MAGDYTRLTFDPRRDRAMVLEQQGRVHLDADFNELVAILERRLRVETYDFAGPAVVPASEPESFKIALSGGHFRVHRGRIYVDGLLAENHGRGDDGYEPVWGEQIGSLWTRLEQQPYLGSLIAYEELFAKVRRGRYLLYLDVWQREQTAVEDPSMLEPALGVDTTTRIQTVWQIRPLRLDKESPRCSDDWTNVEPWVALTSPSPGRLSSWADQPPAPADPCAVAPVGGYRGTENRLYRVEVHGGGGAGAATIKWSRDNGAVATTIVGPIVDAATKPIVTVQRLGRDDVLRFAPTDWVELLDDTHELDGRPGVIGQVESIDQSQSTITLSAALSEPIDPARNPRIRRWDQTAGLTGGVIPIAAFGTTIELEDGIKISLTLDDPAGELRTGDWWVFAARAATASIEELTDAPPRGIRHHYARLAIVQSGKVTDDCRVVFPGDCGCDDCGCGCTVCVTPRSHADDEGPLTIQDAIDRVVRTGGRVCLAEGAYKLRRPLEIRGARGVTLSGEGSRTLVTYLGDGLGIAVYDSVDVTLERFTLAVARDFAAERQDAAKTHHVLDEAVYTMVPPVASAPIGEQTVAIALVNTADCRVDDCIVVSGFAPGAKTSARSINGSLGIGIGGWALRTRLAGNVVFGDVAIGDLTAGRAGVYTTFSYDHLGLAASYLASVDLGISDNLLLGLSAGVDFGSVPARPTGERALAERETMLGPSLQLGSTRIADNLVIGPRAVGIAMLSIAAGAAARDTVEPETATVDESEQPEGMAFEANATHTASSSVLLLGDVLARGLDRVDISGNVLDISGVGIAVSPGNVRVEDNDITGSGATALTRGGGVLLALGTAVGGQAVIAANRIRNVGRFGIQWSGAPGAVEARENQLALVGGYGIAGGLSSRLELATIRDNVVEGVFSGRLQVAHAIQVTGAVIAQVRGNRIAAVGTGAAAAARAGIIVSGCSVTQITDNVLVKIGPSGEHTGVVYGIAYGGTLQTLDVRGNVVELGASGQAGSDIALFIWAGGERFNGLKETEVGSNDHFVVLDQALQRDNPPVLDPVVERMELRRTVRGFGSRDKADYDPVPPRAGDVAVVDNTLRSAAPVPLVLIETAANLTFAQNRVARTGTLVGTPAVVAIAQGATIVSSNRVETTTGGDVAAVALSVDDATTQLPHCTVLGNITSRAIWLNDTPLAGQWAALNIVA